MNETERLLRDLADLAQFPEMNPGAVCRLDKSGTVLLANKAARKLFKNENIMGQKWMNICPDFTEQYWNEIAQSSTSIKHERDIDGGITLFTFLRPDNSDSVFVYGSDITAFRLAERQLAEQSALAGC